MKRVIDVGAGLRPMQLYECDEHICVEPHGPYADRLEAAGYQVVRETAVEALSHLRGDTVFLLDVIEHMTREDGARAVELALEAASFQVVVFTPRGFKPQSGDPWGLGGEVYQEHRSGWIPEDFPGWQIFGHGNGFIAVKTHA